MQRIHVPSGSEETTTLSQILTPLLSQDDDVNKSSSIQVGTTTITDDSQTLSSLGLKHGSLIAITPPPPPSPTETKTTSRFSKTITDTHHFDPYPDLRRDYEAAVLRKAARRQRSGYMSYGDVADIQSALFVVEPQSEGPLKRIYMCHISAERFQSNCITKGKKKGTPPSIHSRVGLLLGTIHRERLDSNKPVKTRTSLSSTPSNQDFCQVAKVHALWEPPTHHQTSSSSNLYETSSLLMNERVLTIASWLGLSPIGWIFSYTDSRCLDDQDSSSLPVWGHDVWIGAHLQIANMKRSNREDGSKFVTLAMDANTGATEAFQFSNVIVQMVAQDMWDGNEMSRFITTRHEIIVDGKETTQLDSVLCLINTAMLSHEGSFAGQTLNSVNKKNGSLTKKTKERLLAALEKDESDHCSLLDSLRDFNILMALDELLPVKDMEELCRLVRKWVRGQKRGTKVERKLKLVLQSVLNS